MKIKINFCFCFVILIFLFTCTSPQKIKVTTEIQSEILNPDLYLELPAYFFSDQIIKHTAYTLKYNEKYEQAEWIAYKLVPLNFVNSIKRTNDFRPDPAVRTCSAVPDDYKDSGYDRGHLAPAADMKYSEITMSESFYMSNMSPQVPEFNRGIWECLEEQVRAWAKQNEELYIVTAGILNDELPVIGKYNRVGVPAFYFKVILDYKEPELKAIAFIFPNEQSNKNLRSFVITIDQVEEQTGIDFFPALPDDIEDKLESSVDLSKWEFRKCK